jgi:hypothetical protein
VRVLPGTYTLRLTKNGKAIETKLEVGLDRRAAFTLQDRKAQHAAVVRVRDLFARMSALAARLVAARDGAATAARETQALGADLQKVSDQADALRKRIVATTEGGNITGEERLREHMDALYGALLTYEGAPAAYLLARTEALARELGEVERDFKALEDGDLAKANAALKAVGKPALVIPGPGAEAQAAAGGAAAREAWHRFAQGATSAWN